MTHHDDFLNIAEPNSNRVRSARLLSERAASGQGTSDEQNNRADDYIAPSGTDLDGLGGETPESGASVSESHLRRVCVACLESVGDLANCQLNLPAAMLWIQTDVSRPHST